VDCFVAALLAIVCFGGRDRTLGAPRLIPPSIQVNIRAGRGERSALSQIAGGRSVKAASSKKTGGPKAARRRR
jgi:hypothetical protein